MESSLHPVRQLGALAVVLMLSAGMLFWQLAVGVHLRNGFVWDESLMVALHGLSQPWLDTVSILFTRTGDVLIVLPLVAMFFYLWRRSERTTAVLLVVSFAIAPLIALLYKTWFDRPRPDVFPPLDVQHTASFPSGHTLTAVAVYGLISVLIWQRGHRFLSIICGIWIFLIALSRVYLGAHYPSDVLASLALGIILLFIILSIDGRLNSHILNRER